MARGKRGRPPATSREQVVEAALQLLEESPQQPLSLNAVARRLGLTPMALYGYVANRDELLHAASELLLSRLQPEIPDDASWQDQLRIWARAVRGYVFAHPGISQLVGWQGHVSSGWLSQLAMLTRILRRAGFEDQPLMERVRWVSGTVMGNVLGEIGARQARVRLDASDLLRLPPDQQEELAVLFPLLSSDKPATSRFERELDLLLRALQ